MSEDLEVADAVNEMLGRGVSSAVWQALKCRGIL